MACSPRQRRADNPQRVGDGQGRRHHLCLLTRVYWSISAPLPERLRCTQHITGARMQPAQQQGK
eukprot:3905157-Prorocentrum_lima.AAC.1